MTAPVPFRVVWCPARHPITGYRCWRLAHPVTPTSQHCATPDDTWGDTPEPRPAAALPPQRQENHQ